jgi:hypothetical protein
MDNSLRRVGIAAAIVVGLAVQVPVARADDGLDLLADCQPATIGAASLKHASPADAARICEISRRKLGFELHVPDMQKLIDAAAVASLNARKRGFDLSLPDAGTNVADIVVLRGMASDRDGFNRTVDLVTRIDGGTDGVVSPAVFLLQLHASGPMAKTMSEEGLIGFAAMVSVEEKRKLAVGSYADQQPTSAMIVDNWRIAGHVMMGGHVAVCFMSQATKSARGEFVYSSGLAANSSVTSIATITIPTSLAAGALPNVTFKFDAGSFTLPGQVAADEVRVGLPKDPGKLDAFIKALTHSKVVQVAVAGRRADSDNIDLTDAAVAFDATGACLKDAVGRATAEMARRNGNAD